MGKRWNWIVGIFFGLLCIICSIIVIVEGNKVQSKPKKETIVVDSSLPKSNESSLEVYNWSSEVKGNYIYITGSIKNTGDVSISYWKVTAEFLDSNGNILDTDYTNDTEIVKPNAMKEFEIMHKDNSEYKKIKVYVSEYR